VKSSLTPYEQECAEDGLRILAKREASRWRVIDRGALTLAWAASLETEKRAELFRRKAES
jgi:hypothetical protein